MVTLQNSNITPQQAYEWLISGEAVLIDVREPDEFKAEHIAYGISLPLGRVGELFQQLKLPTDRKVIFQCLRGKRGETACAVLDKTGAGYAVFNITGGIEGWKAAGLPVVGAGAGKAPMSLFRQVQIVVGLAVLIFVLIGFSGHHWGFVIAGLFGAALAFSGVSGKCGMAVLLAKMPWNKRGAGK